METIYLDILFISQHDQPYAFFILFKSGVAEKIIVFFLEWGHQMFVLSFPSEMYQWKNVLLFLKSLHLAWLKNWRFLSSCTEVHPRKVIEKLCLRLEPGNMRGQKKKYEYSENNFLVSQSEDYACSFALSGFIFIEVITQELLSLTS